MPKDQVNQMDLFIPRLRALEGFKGPIQHRFEAFHDLNPEVYETIVTVARSLKGRGFRRCGMKFIFEHMRWLYALQTKGKETYKLSNVFTAFYARLVMHQEEDLEGFFVLRQQRIPYDPATTTEAEPPPAAPAQIAQEVHGGQ